MEASDFTHHSPKTDIAKVFQYHNDSKHSQTKYAAGPSGLDWQNQPNPFRTFSQVSERKQLFVEQSEELVQQKEKKGYSPRIDLPVPPDFQEKSASTHCKYDELFEHSKEFHSEKLNKLNISQFLYYSMSISAWKQAGKTAWSLRTNPSSGNLHPTECYVVLPQVEGIHSKPGVYHYTPKTHSLELRCELNEEIWKAISRDLPDKSFFVGLTSIHWRESWKYGIRAFRYCQHDAGHAFAALRLSASLLGWKLGMLNGLSDSDISTLLGIDRHQDFYDKEHEEPDLLAAVVPNKEVPKSPIVYKFPTAIKDEIRKLNWQGQANQLSKEYVDWEAIQSVTEASRKLSEENSTLFSSMKRKGQLYSNDTVDNQYAAKIIRQRRSAVDMDGKTVIEKSTFFSILSKLVPSITEIPWDSYPFRPTIHLGIFVHRVKGVDPGLYILVRADEDLGDLKARLKHERVEWLWEKVPGAPKELPLFCLFKQNLQSVAAVVSCQQEIAAESAFSLGMFARFKSEIERFGPHTYRRIFWEAGMIGQVLYLEAEAHGIRGTGIGCYYDDEFHQVIGLKDDTYQDLYHFTIGQYVDDERLQVLDAYRAHDTNKFN